MQLHIKGITPFVCEVQVEAIGGLPNVMDGKAFSHVAINKACASFGFERCSRSDPQDQSIHYSVFLSTYSSRRVQLFKRPLLQRISDQYRYRSYPFLTCEY
jgi:hypothetical protein